MSDFRVGPEPVQKLAQIVAYTMSLSLFFLGLEFFTAFYSGIPGHQAGLQYLFFGYEGRHALVPFMWTSLALGLVALGLLVHPRTRRNERVLALAAAGVFVSSWIDKGLGLVVGGFVPSPLERVTEYSPTLIELTITAGVYGIGLLTLTVLYKAVVSVREEKLIPPLRKARPPVG